MSHSMERPVEPLKLLSSQSHSNPKPVNYAAHCHTKFQKNMLENLRLVYRWAGFLLSDRQINSTLLCARKEEEGRKKERKKEAGAGGGTARSHVVVR